MNNSKNEMSAEELIRKLMQNLSDEDDEDEEEVQLALNGFEDSAGTDKDKKENNDREEAPAVSDKESADETEDAGETPTEEEESPAEDNSAEDNSAEDNSAEENSAEDDSAQEDIEEDSDDSDDSEDEGDADFGFIDFFAYDAESEKAKSESEVTEAPEEKETVDEAPEEEEVVDEAPEEEEVVDEAPEEKEVVDEAPEEEEVVAEVPEEEETVDEVPEEEDEAAAFDNDDKYGDLFVINPTYTVTYDTPVTAETDDTAAKAEAKSKANTPAAQKKYSVVYRFKVKSLRASQKSDEEDEPDFDSAASAITAEIDENGDAVTENPEVRRGIQDAEEYVTSLAEREKSYVKTDSDGSEDEEPEENENAPEATDLPEQNEEDNYDGEGEEAVTEYDSDTEPTETESAADAGVTDAEPAADAGAALLPREEEADPEEDEEDYEEEEPEAPANEQEKKPKLGFGDVDQKDINLMVIFGMDDELEEKIGKDRAEKERRGTEDLREMGEVGRGNEYRSTEQNEEFATYYKKRYIGNTVQLVLSILLLVGAVVLEILSMTGVKLLKSGDNLLLALCALQLTLFCVSAGYREFFGGLRSLFAGHATPETVFSVQAIFTAVYEVAAIAQGERIGEFSMYNAPLALSALFAVVSSRIDLKREMMAFRIISTRKDKYVIVHTDDKDAGLEKAVFDSYLEEGEAPDFLGIRKSGFVKKFVARNVRTPRNKGVIGVLIPLVVTAAIVYFALGYFRADDSATGLVIGLSAAEAVIMIGLPLSMFLAYSFPFYRASKQAFRDGSAIIGESSLEEYANAAVVSFNDKDVFPSKGVKISNFKVFGNNRIDHIMYKTASIYNVLGGPLDEVFKRATKEIGFTNDVDIIEVGHGGCVAAVNGERILIGNGDYLRASGIDLPQDAGRGPEVSGAVCAMYVAAKNGVAAMMYINYRMDPEFESIIKTLCKSGVCLGIRTLDPNITDAMLDRRIKLSKYPVRVIRCENGINIDKPAKEIDSGLVSKQSPKSLLKTLTLCDRVLQVIKTNIAVKIISVCLGIAAVGLLLFVGEILKLNSIWVLLYQAFWIILMMIVSLLFV